MIFGRFDERAHAVYDKPHVEKPPERPPQREQVSPAGVPPR
jgi:hypothetical protein